MKIALQLKLQRITQHSWSIGLAIFSIFAIIVFLLTQRWIFSYQSDPVYLENYYSFSQWAIPLSSRIMGDAPLYQYSGYKLVENFEPFNLVPEVPVVGKLLYGWAIHRTGNPLIVPVIAFLVLLVTIDRLASRFFNFSRHDRWLLLLLLGTSPILVEQLGASLLDLPQATFYFLHVLFLFTAARSKGGLKFWALIGGSTISLGLMTATKIAVYWPVIALVDGWFLWKQRKLIAAAMLLLGSLGVYALTYWPFIVSNGLISWLKAQKWMLNFYRNSDVEAWPGMILISMLSGWYKGWWGAGWEHLKSWNGSWTLSLFVLGSAAKNWWQQRQTNWRSVEAKYLVFQTSLLIVLLAFIPFWPRYLVILVPFLWILVLDWAKQKRIHKYLLFFPLLSLFSMLWQSWNFQPQPFYNHWQKAEFEEMYAYFDRSLKTSKSRSDWVENQASVLQTAQANLIQVTPIVSTRVNWQKYLTTTEVVWSGPQKVTRTEYQIDWMREQGQWRVGEIRQINIESQESLIEPGKAVACVNPTKVAVWTETYQGLGKTLGITAQEAADRIMQLAPRDYCIPVGTLDNETVPGHDVQLSAELD